MLTQRGTAETPAGRLSRRAAIWATFVLPTATVLLAVATFGFADPSRSERDRIAELLEIRPGMTVADIGAGDGAYARDLAGRVGTAGRVFATEVDGERLAAIDRHVAREGLTNIVTVLGDAENTGLSAGCCDAILLRHVYHHFADPAAMRAGVCWALRPRGALLVVDIDRESAGDGHGIDADDLVADMTSHGWIVDRRIDRWEGREGHYGVVFRKAPGD